MAIGQGCSFATVQGPPPVSQRQPGYYCTSSVIMPVIDLTLSMVGFLTAIGALSSPSAAYGGATNSHLLIGGGVLVGGLAFTSGVVGLERTSDCDQAKAADAHGPTLHLERRYPAETGMGSSPDDTRR